MSYVSGRTVKSPTSTATTVVKATRDARRLVTKHLPADMVTVESRNDYDILTHTMLVATTITYPPGTNTADFRMAATRLPGIVGITVDATRIRIRRTAVA